jgi:hypothetical protein
MSYHIGVFGPGRSGKTTLLQKGIVEPAAKLGTRSIVLDIIGAGGWDPSAVVFKDINAFYSILWKVKGCLIVIDEATTTIETRPDEEIIQLFTRIRHNGNTIVVAGHRATNLKPIVREQLGTLYLFRQDENASKMWAASVAEKRLLETQSLVRYEFLYFKAFGAKDGSNIVQKCKLLLK